MDRSRLSILQHFFQFAMLFGFISKIRLGPFTSMRLVLIIAIITLVLKWNRVKAIIFLGLNRIKLRESLALLAVCLIITFIHFFSSHVNNSSYFEPSELLTVVIGVFIMGLWSAVVIKHSFRFAELVVAVGIVQSISVFICMAVPQFQSFVADHFLYEGFYDKVEEAAGISKLARTAGIGIAWSSGSLVLAYCSLMLVFLKINNKIHTLTFSIFYALLFGATALMGRSGMILELIFLLYYAVVIHKQKSIFTLFIVAIIGLFVLNRILERLDPLVAEATREWMFDFLNSDAVARTNEGIAKDGFPPLSSEFIFGTGVTYGNYGKYRFYADSGYIKSYTSVGIVGMFCYYVGVLLIILSSVAKVKDKNTKRLLWVGILSLYLMEYKEPFIGMFIYPWMLFTAGLLYVCQYKQKNTRHESFSCR